VFEGGGAGHSQFLNMHWGLSGTGFHV
jgi:hypothetical protein